MASSEPYLKRVKWFPKDPQIGDGIDIASQPPLVEDGIDTGEFVEAAQAVVGIFKLLNSTALTLVESDLKNNIDRLSKRYESDKEKYKTLERIVKDEAEIAKGKSDSEVSKNKIKDATQALLWLNRGLRFTCAALKKTRSDKSKTMSASFKAAYEETLLKDAKHGFIVRTTIQTALLACPTRETLYAKLGESEGNEPLPDSEIDQQLDEWLKGLDASVKKVIALFEEGDYGKGL